jgi:hypothetical protein
MKFPKTFHTSLVLVVGAGAFVISSPSAPATLPPQASYTGMFPGNTGLTDITLHYPSGPVVSSFIASSYQEFAADGTGTCTQVPPYDAGDQRRVSTEHLSAWRSVQHAAGLSVVLPLPVTR